MRGSVIQVFLLFLLSTGMAQTVSPDIEIVWKELTMLKTVVVEQRVELRNLETRVTEVEVRAEEERNKVLLLTSELGYMSKKVEEQKAELLAAKNKMTELEIENAVLSAELSGVVLRVAASEEHLDNQSRDVATLRELLSTTETQVQLQKIIVDDLEKSKTEQQTRLDALDLRVTARENEAEEQKMEVMSLRADLSSTKTDLQRQHYAIEELQKETGGKIAFSVGLTGLVGPYNTETPLKYNKVFTNIGNAYNTTSGKFVAPFRGVYYFRFTAFDYLNARLYGLRMYRNNQKMMTNWQHNDHVGHLYLSNALILQLNEGDTVYMQLPSRYGLSDDTNNHNTFSGFLLFRL